MVGMGVGLVVITLILTGWRSWWTSTADDYRNVQLYRPTPIQTSVQTVDGQRQLTIRFDTTGYGDRSAKAPDSELYLARPRQTDARFSGSYAWSGCLCPPASQPARYAELSSPRLPQLPAGKYLLFADVVYRSGFAETLTDTVDVPSSKSRRTQLRLKPTDRDDSWLVTEPMGVKAGAVNVPHLDNDMVVCGKPGASVKLHDGSTMLWMDKPGQFWKPVNCIR